MWGSQVHAKKSDIAVMRRALEVAARALDTQDVPIGAVVVDAEGTVVAEAANRREIDHDPTGHAEIIALRLAAAKLVNWRLDDCTLVVTLEPCAMCAGAAMQARVGRLVFGAFDEKAGAVGSLWDVVRDPRLYHQPEVVSGVLAEECAGLLREFFNDQRGSSTRSAVAEG
jgi:tRNA(adenine34) deaminase